MPLAKVALCDQCFVLGVKRLAAKRYWNRDGRMFLTCGEHSYVPIEAELRIEDIPRTDVEDAPPDLLDALKAAYEAATTYIALLHAAYLNLKCDRHDPNWWPMPSSKELADVSQSWVDAVAALDRILKSQDEKGD